MRKIQPNTYNGRDALAKCLQSFAVFELLQNSSNLFIHSPIMNDLFILDNRAGEFASMLPDPTLERLTLTNFLQLLADRGTSIKICYRDEITSLTIEKLQHPLIQLQQRSSIYPPGWISEKYAISGIVYFRADRVGFSEDEIEILTEQDRVEELYIKADSTW